MVCTVAHSPKIGASALTDVAVNNNFSTEKGDQQWQHDPCKGQPSAQIGLTKLRNIVFLIIAFQIKIWWSTTKFSK